jgi:hypothetical protein
MSDESSGGGPAWRSRAGHLDLEDPDVLRDLAGRIDSIRPIGPLSLRLRTRRLYILVAVAVTALLCGAGAALVVAGSGTPVAAANASAPGPAPSASAPSSSGPAHAPSPDILHGQYVVRAAAGGYQTIDEQTGQVVAVSGSAITLRSIDGFTERYLVSKSTVVDSGHDRIAAVKVGDQASLDAAVSGSTATVTTLDDLTILQHRGSALDSGRGLAGSAAPQAR